MHLIVDFHLMANLLDLDVCLFQIVDHFPINYKIPYRKVNDHRRHHHYSVTLPSLTQQTSPSAFSQLEIIALILLLDRFTHLGLDKLWSKLCGTFRGLN